VHGCTEPIKFFEEIKTNHIAGFSKKFGGAAVRVYCYIHFDDTIETEEVVINEKEIIEEILQTYSNEGNDIEIEKIPHSTTLE